MNIHDLSTALAKTFSTKLQTNVVAHGEVTVDVSAADLLYVCEQLRDDETFRFEQLIDVCGVDYSEYGSTEWATESTSSTGYSRGVEPGTGARLRFSDAPSYTNTDRPRFASVYHLLSLQNNHRMRIRVYCESETLPVVPSVLDIWPSADWFERESFDLFGIIYEGHPDLRRILTDYGFVGHPFRKDFPLIGHVEMKYDETQKRVIYQPVSIEPRVLVPRVIRDDGRFDDATSEEVVSAAMTSESSDA